MSPVLQRRRAEQQNAAAGPATMNPVFNFSLGNEVADLFRLLAHIGAAPAPHPILPIPAAMPAFPQHTSTLLHPSRHPGADMAIANFCELYQLGGSVLQKFTENGYTHSRMLRFIEIEELKQMKFLLGEIAGLKDAVETWSIGIPV
jgi:hypothetical protein